MALGTGAIAAIVCVCIVILIIAIISLIYFCKKNSYKIGAQNYEKLPLKSNAPKYQANTNPIGQDSYEKDRENANLNCKFYLRSIPSYSLEKQLSQIGNRSEKHHFLVSEKNGSKILMSIFKQGKDNAIPLHTETCRFAFSNVLTVLNSPFIFPTIKADWLLDRERAVIFRKFKKKGSLRDIIYKANPIKQSFQLKYKERGNPLTEKRIASWGRHILEGMNYLRLKGFPAGNIHSGNIMVEKNICKISDYENKLLNLIPFQSDIAFNNGLRKRGVDNDVICFGAILFEMGTGYIMDEVDLQESPSVLVSSKPVLEILEWIFWPTTKEDHAQPPLLKELLDLKFFSKVEMPSFPSLSKIKLGKKGKEILKIARNHSILNKNSSFSPSSSSSSSSSSKSVYSKKKQRETQSISSQPSLWKDQSSNSSSNASTNSSSTNSTSLQKSSSNVPPPPNTNNNSNNNNNNNNNSNNKAQNSSNRISSPNVQQKTSPSPQTPVKQEEKQDQPGRDQLLSSIGNFSKNGLKKTVTNDRSSPLIEKK
eukprot:TRINITY_DN610_c4_g1_i1.p1 TRINITY_DN610_c4_g1~~TRINITY_DN610_c4_g1_i1.p1  ORF type:complete len:537 (+),score=187.03 TRINITY_DN610_c4_g1_i1:11-1621(+)